MPINNDRNDNNNNLHSIKPVIRGFAKLQIIELNDVHLHTSTSALDHLSSVIFSIVINTWQEWDVSNILLPLSHTCKALHSHRLLKDVIEKQGYCYVEHALIPKNYQYQNLSLKSVNDFLLLEKVFQFYKGYKIRSLTIDLCDERYPHQLHKDIDSIRSITSHLPPFQLNLIYSHIPKKLTGFFYMPIIVNIPDNINKFFFSLFHGLIDLIASPTSNLRSLKLHGDFTACTLTLPSVLSMDLERNTYRNSSYKPCFVPHLTEIHFPLEFNNKLETLQEMTLLERVIFPFGSKFNHPLDNNLPSSLKLLQIGGSYSHSLHQLPPKISTLIASVCSSYQHHFDHLPNLQNLWLRIGTGYNYPISTLPDSIQTLYIKCFNASQLITKIPQGLMKLTIEFSSIEKCTIDATLPLTLRTLQLKSLTNSFNAFPPNLTCLDIGMEEGISKATSKRLNYLILNELPFSLHTLILPSYFNEPLSSMWNSLINLKRLEMGSKFNQPLAHLPPNIEFLEFKAVYPHLIEFNQELGPLPPNLKELRFQGCSLFNQGFSHQLPSDLRVLQLIGPAPAPSAKQNISSKFNQPLSETVLPLSLQTIHLGTSYAHEIVSLPPSVTTVFLANTYSFKDVFRIRFGHISVHEEIYNTLKQQLRSSSKVQQKPHKHKHCKRPRF